MSGRTLHRELWRPVEGLEDVRRALAERVTVDWERGSVVVILVDRTGGLASLVDLMVSSPELRRAIPQSAGNLRYTELSLLHRELAIVLVAVADCVRYVWDAYRASTLAARVDPVAAWLVQAGVKHVLEERARGLHHVNRSLVAKGDLGSGRYEETVERFGWRCLQGLVRLVGIYRAFGLAMGVTRTPLPDTPVTFATWGGFRG